jgi:putative transcriptional regulator
MNSELFKELAASVREGGAILRGEKTPARTFAVAGPNVKRLRATYQLSQNEFAALLGISVKTLRNWEQGRRMPEGPARILLQVAAKHPDAVWDVVRPASHSKLAKASRPSKAAQA